MNKAVMISIQPKWCELIANGKKTIEVRKTKPKLEIPFKVYIYETQGRTETPFIDQEGHHIFKGRGQVIGYFVCDWISTYFYGEMKIPTPAYDGDDSCIDYGDGYYISCGGLKQTCLTYEEFENYGKGETLYGWHISNLVIYDKPKELSEFLSPEWFRDCEKQCDKFEYMRCPTRDSRKVDKMCGWCRRGGKPLTRAFQSWGYVEEQK